MAEARFRASLENLTGKIAIVTGGAAGIGFETTKYLAQQGCTVYVASRKSQKTLDGIARAEDAIQDGSGVVRFHELDLASIATAKESAKRFREVESRIDIIVANAGISLVNLAELSPDGYERIFATNHMGHFAFITSLLDIVEGTSTKTGDARIVVTSSLGYRSATKLDYTALTTAVPGDGSSIKDIKTAYDRYCNSKLANVYFTNELDKQLQRKGFSNVYCNSCHPGIAGNTGLGRGGFGAVGGRIAERIVEILMNLLNTVEDAAKTQTFLAAGAEIRENGIHGQYWTPQWSWTQRYLGCQEEELTGLGKDQNEQRKLWEFSEQAEQKASDRNKT